MTDIKERLRIVSQSPRSFDTALLKDALGEIERLEGAIRARGQDVPPAINGEDAVNQFLNSFEASAAKFLSLEPEDADMKSAYNWNLMIAKRMRDFLVSSRFAYAVPPTQSKDA
jgi:hypothetical protein